MKLLRQKKEGGKDGEKENGREKERKAEIKSGSEKDYAQHATKWKVANFLTMSSESLKTLQHLTPQTSEMCAVILKWKAGVQLQGNLTHANGRNV